MQIISCFQTKLLQPFVIPAMNVAIFRQLHCHLLDRADNSLLIACIRGWAVSVVQRPYCQSPGIVTSKYTWGKNVILSWSITFFLCSCYHTPTKQNTINSHKPRKIQTLQLHLLKKYGVTKLLIKKFSHFFNYFLPLVCLFGFPGVTTHCGCIFTARQRALASSFSRFLDHTQRRATVGRIPLDE